MKRLMRCNISGHDPTVSVPGRDLLSKELMFMGSRYATKQEVIDALDLVARGDIWPLVTDVRPMAEAKALHQSVEKGEVTGRAAILIK